MSYQNKTYVIFDGDKDIWAYGFMKGWKSNDNVEFDFYDAHELKTIRNESSEETIKRTLRARMKDAKQVIVVIGESTRHLYRYVRWEMELALEMGLPIIAVNLNGTRGLDSERCPAIIRDEYVVHVPFKMAIIRYAMQFFPQEYAQRDDDSKGPRYYSDEIYKKLGLI